MKMLTRFQSKSIEMDIESTVCPSENFDSNPPAFNTRQQIQKNYDDGSGCLNSGITGSEFQINEGNWNKKVGIAPTKAKPEIRQHQALMPYLKPRFDAPTCNIKSVGVCSDNTCHFYIHTPPNLVDQENILVYFPGTASLGFSKEIDKATANELAHKCGMKVYLVYHPILPLSSLENAKDDVINTLLEHLKGQNIFIASYSSGAYYALSCISNNNFTSGINVKGIFLQAPVLHFGENLIPATDNSHHDQDFKKEFMMKKFRPAIRHETNFYKGKRSGLYDMPKIKSYIDKQPPGFLKITTGENDFFIKHTKSLKAALKEQKITVKWLDGVDHGLVWQMHEYGGHSFSEKVQSFIYDVTYTSKLRSSNKAIDHRMTYQ
jgi:acetyl esterase/lipase